MPHRNIATQKLTSVISASLRGSPVVEAVSDGMFASSPRVLQKLAVSQTPKDRVVTC